MTTMRGEPSTIGDLSVHGFLKTDNRNEENMPPTSNTLPSAQLSSQSDDSSANISIYGLDMVWISDNSTLDSGSKPIGGSEASSNTIASSPAPTTSGSSRNGNDCPSQSVHLELSSFITDGLLQKIQIQSEQRQNVRHDNEDDHDTSHFILNIPTKLASSRIKSESEFLAARKGFLEVEQFKEKQRRAKMDWRGKDKKPEKHTPKPFLPKLEPLSEGQNEPELQEVIIRESPITEGNRTETSDLEEEVPDIVTVEPFSENFVITESPPPKSSRSNVVCRPPKMQRTLSSPDVAVLDKPTPSSLLPKSIKPTKYALMSQSPIEPTNHTLHGLLVIYLISMIAMSSYRSSIRS